MRSWMILGGFGLVAACSSSSSPDPADGGGGSTSSSASSSSGASSTSSSSSSSSGSSGASSGGMDAGVDGDADASTDPLAALSDDFQGTTLGSGWTVLRPELVAITVAQGNLVVRATASSLWFNTSQGPLVHKSVTGDFKVTSRVRARRASNDTLAPAIDIHLGGLMVRNPAAPPENHLFVVTGRDDQGELSVETKTTTNGASVYTNPVWPSGDAEVRICRLGATFRLYKREIAGGAWAAAATFERADMPATVQVGAAIYALSQTPDLVVSFDEITFATVASEAGCTAD